MGIVESYESLAKRFGMSRIEVIRRIRNLEKMGYLTVQRQKGQPNVYFVHFFPKAS
jgi:DNA-binding GntR family transcriptional regulator